MDFSDYDIGYRQGVFAKCNGQPRMAFTGIETDRVWFDGFDDGYDGNDVIIPAEEIVPTGSTFDTDFGALVERKVYQLWIEGDWGQNYYIFGSEASAKAKATELIAAQSGGDDDEWTCYEDAEKEGLAGIEELTFIP